MTQTCSKCGKSNDENQTDLIDTKQYACSNCRDEWAKYSVMVINEMRLDMSLPEHRKMLKKYERVFFGLEKPEEGMKDLSKEEERVPDKN